MKSTSISYRIADFLKQYPPFQYATVEELVELAMSGRVRFHETDELIIRKGMARKPYLFVIQQGSVEILDQIDGKEELKDLRGPGDMIGVGHFLGAKEYVRTARTASDVIVYALRSDAVEALAARHPAFSRYLAAYFSVNPGYPIMKAVPGSAEDALGIGSHSCWLTGVAAIAERARMHRLSCMPRDTVKGVAVAMTKAGAAAIAVVDGDGRPLGWVDDARLREQVVTGKVGINAPITAVMCSPLPVAALDQSPGAYLLRMMAAGVPVVGLTEDGTAGTPVAGLVRAADLALQCGDNPLEVTRAIGRAEAVDELCQLLKRGDALIAAALQHPSSVEWNAKLAAEFDRALFRRIVQRAEASLRSEGLPDPGLDSCWLLFGSAGRGERFGRAGLQYGLLYADPPADQAAAARDWFSALAHGVAAGFAACEFVIGDDEISPTSPQWCHPLCAWQELYTRWIRDPIGSRTYTRLAFFDLRPICGNQALVDWLGQHAKTEIGRDRHFLALLANDSMANLPPLTFFKGLVVDDAGARSEVLDLWRCVLQPLVDVARVLALDAGAFGFASTSDRLTAVAAADPEHAVLFRDGVEGFRVALYHHARAVLRDGKPGGEIDPAALDRFDQQLFKGTFRAILGLLELTALRFGLAPRR